MVKRIWWIQCETERKRCNHESVCYLSTMGRAMDSSTHSTVRRPMFQSRGRGHNLRQIQWVSQSVRRTRLTVRVHSGIFLCARAPDASQPCTLDHQLHPLTTTHTHTHWLHLIGWMPLANIFGHILFYWNERLPSARPSWILTVLNVFPKTF